MTNDFNAPQIVEGKYWKIYTARNGFTQWAYNTDVGLSLRILLPDKTFSDGKFKVCEMLVGTQGEYCGWRVLHEARTFQGAYRKFIRIRNGEITRKMEKARHDSKN